MNGATDTIEVCSQSRYDEADSQGLKEGQEDDEGRREFVK